MDKVTHHLGKVMDVVADNFTYKLFHEAPSAYVVPVTFSLIFLVGTVGNGTVIYTVARNKDMRSTSGILIVSLAAGDMLLLVLSVPFTATYYSFNWWPYGSAICKLDAFIQCLSRGVSAFTLTALSVDSYMTIVYSMGLQHGSLSVRALIITSCIWALALVLATLDAVLARLVPINLRVLGEEVHICDSYPIWFPEWYTSFRVIFHFVVYFALPVLTFAIFYLLMAPWLIRSSHQIPRVGQNTTQMKAQKKIAHIVLSFIVIFVFCWLPRHVYMFWYFFDPAEYNLFWHIFKITGFCLSFSYCCLKPVALYFLSAQFRSYFNSYLLCCCQSKEDGRRSNTQRGTFGDNTEAQGTV